MRISDKIEDFKNEKIIFSTFVKFHIFLLILTDSFQRLVLEYLVFFTGKEALGTAPPKFSNLFYITFFSVSFISYVYGYLCGILEKDPKFPVPFFLFHIPLLRLPTSS